MRALTVWQPWAMLIAAGVKVGEYRRWRPPRTLKFGTDIAIHAGTRRPQRKEMRDITTYVEHYTSAQHSIMDKDRAIVLLDTPVRDMIYGSIVAIVQVDDATFNDPLWCWKLSNIRPTISPPVRGAQQLWTVPPDLEIEYLGQW